MGGAFLNKKNHPEQFDVWSKLLKDFGVKTATSIINNELDVANRAQNKFISEQKQLENDIKDYQNDIEKMKKEIVDNEKRIEEAKSKQTAKQADIKKQEEVLESLRKKIKSIH